MSDILVEKVSLRVQLIEFDPYERICVISSVHGVVLGASFYSDWLLDHLDPSLLDRDDIYIHFSDELDCWCLYIYN